jgi:hypothetical protein
VFLLFLRVDPPPPPVFVTSFLSSPLVYPCFPTCLPPPHLVSSGFLTCLREYGRELTGERSGVYVPIKGPIKAAEGAELPPKWAAVGATAERGAKLVVSKGGEEVRRVPGGGGGLCPWWCYFGPSELPCVASAEPPPHSYPPPRSAYPP